MTPALYVTIGLFVLTLIINGFVFLLLRNQKLEGQARDIKIDGMIELLKKDLDSSEDKLLAQDKVHDEKFEKHNNLIDKLFTKFDEQTINCTNCKKDTEDKIEKAVNHKAGNAEQADKGLLKMIEELQKDVKELTKMIMQTQTMKRG